MLPLNRYLRGTLSVPVLILIFILFILSLYENLKQTHSNAKFLDEKSREKLKQIELENINLKMKLKFSDLSKQNLADLNNMPKYFGQKYEEAVVHEDNSENLQNYVNDHDNVADPSFEARSRSSGLPGSGFQLTNYQDKANGGGVFHGALTDLNQESYEISQYHGAQHSENNNNNDDNQKISSTIREQIQSRKENIENIQIWNSRPGQNLQLNLVPHDFLFEDINSPNPSKIHSTILKTIEYILKTPGDFFVNYNDFKTVDVCSSKLAIMVAGAPRNVERREIIRNHWSKFADDRNFGVILFLVGVTGLTEEEISHLKDEQAIHNDIIMVDYKEMYDLLTIKTVAQMVFYSKFCENVIRDFNVNQQFMLHIDDDLYLDLKTLKDMMFASNNPNNSNGTRIFTQAHDRIFCLDKALMKSDGFGTYPHRKGKYIITEREFSKERFPAACAGTAFMFSYSLTKRLVNEIPNSMPIRLEDIYVTGILRQLAKIPNPIVIRPKLVDHLKSNLVLFEKRISSMEQDEV